MLQVPALRSRNRVKYPIVEGLGMTNPSRNSYPRRQATTIAHLSPAHLRNEVAKTERRSEPSSISAQGSAQEVAELEAVSSK